MVLKFHDTILYKFTKHASITDGYSYLGSENKESGKAEKVLETTGVQKIEIPEKCKRCYATESWEKTDVGKVCTCRQYRQ